MATMDPKLATLLKSLGHAVLGAASAAAATYIPQFVTFIPHIDPLTAAIIGSALSSLVSAWSPKPNANGGSK